MGHLPELSCGGLRYLSDVQGVDEPAAAFASVRIGGEVHSGNQILSASAVDLICSCQGGCVQQAWEEKSKTPGGRQHLTTGETRTRCRGSDGRPVKDTGEMSVGGGRVSSEGFYSSSGAVASAFYTVIYVSYILQKCKTIYCSGSEQGDIIS